MPVSSASSCRIWSTHSRCFHTKARPLSAFLRVYTHQHQGQAWLTQYTVSRSSFCDGNTKRSAICTSNHSRPCALTLRAVHAPCMQACTGDFLAMRTAAHLLPMFLADIGPYARGYSASEEHKKWQLSVRTGGGLLLGRAAIIAFDFAFACCLAHRHWPQQPAPVGPVLPIADTDHVRQVLEGSSVLRINTGRC